MEEEDIGYRNFKKKDRIDLSQSSLYGIDDGID